MTRIYKCWRCKHYKKIGNTMSCSAFPDGIPREVFSEEILHFKKMENQVGDFIFEPTEKEDYYKKYFAFIEELIRKRSFIEKEVVELVNGIIEDLNAKNITQFIRGEIRIHRSDSKMIIKDDEILFFDFGGKPELVSIGSDSELFKKLKSILLIECIENHKTDLEFIINHNNSYDFKFSNLTFIEKKRQNALISLIHHQRAKDKLIEEGLLAISSEKLKVEIQTILEKENENDLPYDREILSRLRVKGFAVLSHEVTKYRRELGFKSKRELRIGNLKTNNDLNSK